MFFFVFKKILKTIYLKIFNKMLVCCKLRPIVFNFPFRRNQFLPKRHFSGRLANSSELIFSFLDPFLQLVANYVLLSFRSIIIFLILFFCGVILTNKVLAQIETQEALCYIVDDIYIKSTWHNLIR